MLIDYEAVVHDVEAYIEGKDGNSFGERELTDLLRSLRVRHRIQEGLPERALRLYGPQLAESLRGRPAPSDLEGSDRMDASAPSPEGGSTNGHRAKAAAGA
jgi:hypothetical protein